MSPSEVQGSIYEDVQVDEIQNIKMTRKTPFLGSLISNQNCHVTHTIIVGPTFELFDIRFGPVLWMQNIMKCKYSVQFWNEMTANG